MLLLCVTLSACTVVPQKVDEDLLKFCKRVPDLVGLDGEAVLKWAEVAGPIIEECRLNNNALVMVLKNSK